jgi:hypothetical protein
MLKRLVALIFLLGGCATGLGDHQDLGTRQDLGAGQDLAALPQPCSGLRQADCAHATGCHLIFTPEELCNSVCCASHFDYCTDGKSANCDGQRSGVCGVSCALPTPTCVGSLVEAYSDDGCCPLGCVAISQCSRISSVPSSQCASGLQDRVQLGSVTKSACDPGDLTALGPQGCP